MAEPARSAPATARRPRVAFVCPFDLDRLAGTPVRAKLDVQAAAGVADPFVVATGGTFAAGRRIDGVWRSRANRGPRFRPWRFVRAAVPALAAHRPDVVHAVGPLGMLPALLHRLRGGRARVVFEMHGITFDEARAARRLVRLLLGLLDWVSLVAADGVVVMSHTQRALVARWPLVSSRKIAVLWGPEDTARFPLLDPPPAPPFRVGYLGKDNYWQGVETLLAAARRLPPGVEVVVGGFDPTGRTGAAPANVRFVGPVPRDRVPAFLGSCHVLVSPRVAGRVTEGQYPQKLSTYLAAGRPVVASDVNDQRRVVSAAGCGLVCLPGDPHALADAIARVVALPAAERLEMGRRARAFAERRLSLAALERELASVYGVAGEPPP